MATQADKEALEWGGGVFIEWAEYEYMNLENFKEMF